MRSNQVVTSPRIGDAVSRLEPLLDLRDEHCNTLRQRFCRSGRVNLRQPLAQLQLCLPVFGYGAAGAGPWVTFDHMAGRRPLIASPIHARSVHKTVPSAALVFIRQNSIDRLVNEYLA